MVDITSLEGRLGKPDLKCFEDTLSLVSCEVFSFLDLIPLDYIEKEAEINFNSFIVISIWQRGPEVSFVRAIRNCRTT